MLSDLVLPLICTSKYTESGVCWGGLYFFCEWWVGMGVEVIRQVNVNGLQHTHHGVAVFYYVYISFSSTPFFFFLSFFLRLCNIIATAPARPPPPTPLRPSRPLPAHKHDNHETTTKLKKATVTYSKRAITNTTTEPAIIATAAAAITIL